MINIPGLAEPTEAFRGYYLCAVDPLFDCSLARSGAAAPADAMAEKGGSSIAARPRLQQNAPNPFNPSTTISFEVPDGVASVTRRPVAGR